MQGLGGIEFPEFFENQREVGLAARYLRVARCVVCLGQRQGLLPGAVDSRSLG